MLKKYEYLIAGLIVLMVSGVTIHGHKLFNALSSLWIKYNKRELKKRMNIINGAAPSASPNSEVCRSVL